MVFCRLYDTPGAHCYKNFWNTPTQDLINTYETDDMRKDASIAVAEGTYNSKIFL